MTLIPAVLQNPDGSWRLSDDPTTFPDRETAEAFRVFRDAHTLPTLRALPELHEQEYST